MTTETFHYVAMNAPEKLARQAEKFISTFEGNPKGAQGPELVTLINLLSAELVSYFLTEPAALAQLTPVQMKVIDFCASTSAKVCSMVSNKLYKKRDNKELARIASYIKQLYTQIDGDGSYIAFPVGKEFVAMFQPLIDANETGNAPDGETLVNIIDELTGEIMDKVFLHPTELVKLSMVTKKVLDVGIDSCEKALHAVNDKVVKKLNGEQLATYACHYSAVLKTVTKEEALQYA
ncbi:MAG: hypothetical protein KUG82_20100 [Pseudomonadales bacterium]|nr:hypothetical protein [Pseudomonadales bacterium]